MNTSDLLNYFSFNEDERYSDVTHLRDVKAGFSVKQKYPANCRFVPAKQKSGECDTVALYKFIFDEGEGASDIGKLTISISKFSNHMNHRYDLDPTQPDCPTDESLKASANSPQPIDVKFGDYFFCVSTGQVLKKKKRPIKIKKLLEYTFKTHLSRTYRFRGFPLRSKERVRSLMFFLMGKIHEILKWVLGRIFGRNIDGDDAISDHIRGYKNSALKMSTDDPLTVFGYKTTKHVVVLFGLITVFCAVLYAIWGQEVKFLNRLFGNPIFVAGEGIVIIWVIDSVLPKTIFYLMNVAIRVRSSIALGQMKIHEFLGVYF